MENCSRCKGSGWVIEDQQGTEVARRCPDCGVHERVSHLLRSAAIPPRYFDRGFDVYSIHHSSQGDALKRSIDFVEHFPDVARGLLFVGPCGVGKTHLSVAILKSLIQERRIRALFVDEAELLRRLQFSYGPDSEATEREVLLPLLEFDLLVWDDLGTGRPTEWVKDTLRMVINHRYTYQKHTIMTSNWLIRRQSVPGNSGRVSPDQSLEERLGTRLYSRVMEMCEVVEISGPDARRQIHKAGLDFQRRKVGKKPDTGKEPEFQCQRCESLDIEILDKSAPKRSKGQPYTEISCLCRSCSLHFLARYFSKTQEVTYPTHD